MNTLEKLKSEIDNLYSKMQDAYNDADYWREEAKKLEEKYLNAKDKWEEESKRLVG